MSDLSQQTSTPAKRRGRPSAFDRDAVTAQIAGLFWDRGYDGVALSDIMSVTGLNKSSLYNGFGDKAAMFQAGLDWYHDQVVEAGAEWLALDDGSDPRDKLAQFLSGPADDVFGPDPDSRGCFLCNTAADGPSGEVDADRLVTHGFDRLRGALTVLMGRIAPDLSEGQAADLASLCLHTYSGMRVRSRFAKSRDELDATRRAFLRLIDSADLGR